MASDELQARQLLLGMQERLSRDPFDALGLTNSERADVRTAFLALTKIYHPARFARMSTDIQRLANEVFLALRAAHDTLTRAQVKQPVKTTGVLPTFRPTGSSGTSGRPPTGTIPVVRPSPTAVAPRAGTVGGAASGQGSGPVARPPVPATRGGTPTTGVPTTRGGTQAQATQSMRPIGAASPNDASRPTRMPSSSPPPVAVAKPGAGAASSTDPELAAIEELLAEDRLTDARMKLEALSTRQPENKRVQARIHYAKGREAQLAQRIDEARVELMDALQLDPDLLMAKTAQVELFKRRK